MPATVEDNAVIAGKIPSPKNKRSLTDKSSGGRLTKNQIRMLAAKSALPSAT